MGMTTTSDKISCSDKIKNNVNSNFSIDPISHNLVKFVANAEFVAPPPTPYVNSNAAQKLQSSSTHSIHTVSLSDAKHDSLERSNRIAAKLIEDSNFTFKPKVSQTSLKIAQNLSSDFMSRQQLHLEKQKKYNEQAILQFKSPIALGRLSPATHSRVSKATSARHMEKLSAENLEKENVVPENAEVIEESAIVSDGNNNAVPCDVLNEESNTEAPNTKDENIEVGLSRSQTLPVVINGADTRSTSPSAPRKHTLTNINIERVKKAKDQAEKAIKTRRVFTIQGPYPAIRASLRRRGWVEKFYKLHYAGMTGPGGSKQKSPRAKKQRAGGGHPAPSDDSDSDDDDDDDDVDPDADDPNDHGGGKVPPWEEDNGIYGIMSRVVRNAPPTFVWGVRRDVIDPKTLKKDQIINHYAKATFTTKVGLCINMRSVPWFEPADPDTFFPRCYRLSHDDEKGGFIDDFRLTTCTSLLKWVVQRHSCDPAPIPEGVCTNPDCTQSRPNTSQANRCIHVGSAKERTKSPANTSRADALSRASSATSARGRDSRNSSKGSGSSTKRRSPVDTTGFCKSCLAKAVGGKKKKRGGYVPLKAVEQALVQCQRYLRSLRHDDIDDNIQQDQMADCEWDQLIQWYYRVIHDEAVITHTHTVLEEVEKVLEEIENVSPQYALDGIRNVWIVKPGAKSRGRGIQCYDRLEDMLRLVNSTVVKKEGKYVVQKYIERPLLVHNYKFDIRQWFLVTDWNPLTLWFYKDSYVRFCSKEYTLENLEEAIHLSNNAVQYKYELDKSAKIPSHLMWSSDEFKQFLKQRGHSNVWEEKIYPGMKRAILCALLCTQDIIEYRKSAFELYGADFMLTENLQPWLIEVNSSPSMSYSTPVTAKLCEEVLEDTVKVVLDRRSDKSADTGKFELAFRQPQVNVPPYIGMNLTVEGQLIRKPAWMTPKKTEAGPSVSKISIVSQPKIDQSGVSKSTTAVNRDQASGDKQVTVKHVFTKAPNQLPVSKSTAQQPLPKPVAPTVSSSKPVPTSSVQPVNGRMMSRAERAAPYTKANERTRKSHLHFSRRNKIARKVARGDVDPTDDNNTESDPGTESGDEVGHRPSQTVISSAHTDVSQEARPIESKTAPLTSRRIPTPPQPVLSAKQELTSVLGSSSCINQNIVVEADTKQTGRYSVVVSPSSYPPRPCSACSEGLSQLLSDFSKCSCARDEKVTVKQGKAVWTTSLPTTTPSTRLLGQKPYNFHPAGSSVLPTHSTTVPKSTAMMHPPKLQGDWENLVPCIYYQAQKRRQSQGERVKGSKRIVGYPDCEISDRREFPRLAVTRVKRGATPPPSSQSISLHTPLTANSHSPLPPGVASQSSPLLLDGSSIPHIEELLAKEQRHREESYENSRIKAEALLSVPYTPPYTPSFCEEFSSKPERFKKIGSNVILVSKPYLKSVRLENMDSRPTMLDKPNPHSVQNHKLQSKKSLAQGQSKQKRTTSYLKPLRSKKTTSNQPPKLSFIRTPTPPHKGYIDSSYKLKTTDKVRVIQHY